MVSWRKNSVDIINKSNQIKHLQSKVQEEKKILQAANKWIIKWIPMTVAKCSFIWLVHSWRVNLVGKIA
jgi:hypothetical protein